MIEAQVRVDFDQSAVFQFQNSAFYSGTTTKSKVLIPKSHSTSVSNEFVAIHVKRGRQFFRIANQPGPTGVT